MNRKLYTLFLAIPLACLTCSPARGPGASAESPSPADDTIYSADQQPKPGPVPAKVCKIKSLEPAQFPACLPPDLSDTPGDIQPLKPWVKTFVAKQAKILASKDAADREVAARVLGLVGPAASSSAPALLGALDDSDPVVKVRAAEALILMGRSRGAALGALDEALASQRRDVLLPDLAAISHLGPLACGSASHVSRLLDSEPDEVRAAAARALGSMGASGGAPAADALVKALSDPVPWVASVAYQSLAAFGAPAVPALVQVLRAHVDAASPTADPATTPSAASVDADAPAKNALGALITMGPAASAARPALECLLADKHHLVLELTVEALAGIAGSGGVDLMPLFIAAIRDEDAYVKLAAQKALAALGAPAVPAIVKEIAAGDESRAWIASGALLSMEPAAAASAIPGLMALLSPDSQPEARKSAAILLQYLGPAAPDPDAIVGALAKALADDGWKERWWAARALGAFGAKAIPALTGALSCADRQVGQTAAEALGAMGAEAAPAVAILIDFLGNDDWSVKNFAAQALGKIGEASAPAVPLLVGALGKEPPVLAGSAAQALGGIGKPAVPAIPQILEGFAAADPTHREFYAVALGSLGPLAAPGAGSLAAMLQDPSPEVRAQAAWALGELGPAAGSSAVKALAAAIPDEYMGYNIHAIETLGKIGHPAAKSLPAVLKAMDSEGYSTVRIAAIKTAVAIGGKPKKVVPALVDALSDCQPDVKAAACAALASYGPGAVAALPALIGVLDDPGAADAVWNALDAIAAMGPKAKTAVPAAIRHLEYLSTRDAASKAIVSVGKAALPAVLEALSKDPWRTDEALSAILAAILKQ